MKDIYWVELSHVYNTLQEGWFHSYFYFVSFMPSIFVNFIQVMSTVFAPVEKWWRIIY